MADIAPPAPPGLKTQVLRFAVTGGISAVVDFGLYLVLHTGLGVQLDVAKALSFVAGTVTAYLINRRWTFAAAPSRSRFLKVIALYALTFTVQVGLNHLCVQLLGPRPLTLPTAFVVAQGTAAVINFAVQRFWIFRHP